MQIEELSALGEGDSEVNEALDCLEYALELVESALRKSDYLN